jgi:hypothetical protein
MFAKEGLIELGGDISGGKKEYDFSCGGSKRGSEDNCFYAPTPTLAICRAFLACETESEKE